MKIFISLMLCAFIGLLAEGAFATSGLAIRCSYFGGPDLAYITFFKIGGTNRFGFDYRVFDNNRFGIPNGGTRFEFEINPHSDGTVEVSGGGTSFNCQSGDVEESERAAPTYTQEELRNHY